ncbi:MAG: hypothetical protein KF910_11665 [Brevundimonas sp.]|uniref:hypothetical protein n=1 Tax=Brevundimonas sp. TaxID=1871086 RepID=UPI0025B7EB54|nr:hypothetical protein [Brevundimonas sp.]MBX3478259.1 hypothetical protein [Brevundimonas sp.]
MNADPEILVVGAGPAGLTAAAYLGRFLRQTTSVPGLYAAGDVVRDLNRIAVATAEAAVAATAIHNRLREADGWTVQESLSRWERA